MRDGDLSPQFKNGWLARHFAKVVNVKGVEHQLGDNTSIIDVVHGNQDSLISVGYQTGVARCLAERMQKQVRLRGWTFSLPDYGRIADAAISPDGKWLALALDEVVNEGDC